MFIKLLSIPSKSIYPSRAMYYITFLLLVFGNTGYGSDVETRQLDPQIVASISGNIQDGTSLSGTSVTGLMNTLDHRNVVELEVDNYSKWAMTSPICYPEGGVVALPPREIHPGQREVMLARKTSFTATGTYGTVSWLIDDRRIIVMWNDPFNYNFYDNKLAIGIIPSTGHTRNIYDTMMHGSGNFTRGVYDDNVQTIEYCDDVLCIEGTMGTSHRTLVHIQVIPKDIHNVARVLETNLPEEVIG